MAISILEPKEIKTAELTFYKFDIAEKYKYFIENQKNGIANPRFRHEGNVLHVKIIGEITGKGINVMTFNKKATYSVGVGFKDEDNLEALNSVQEWYAKYLKESGSEFENFNLLDLVKEDRIYLKLRVDDEGKRFLCQSNLKMNPKRIEDSNVYQGQSVTVECDFGVYANFENKNTGLNFTVKSIDFAEE